MQKLLQIASRMGVFAVCDLLGSARRDDRTAAVTALGTEVNDVIRRFDDVEIMLDDEHGIAVLAKAIQNRE